MRYLHKSLGTKNLKATNVYVTGEGEIFVGAILPLDSTEEVTLHVRAILGQGRMVEMHLDEFIANSLDAPEAYLRIASKIFPAVKP